MNKKFFAALASATMALSATGSLAVFADDFDVVTESNGTNGTVIGTVVPNSGVKVDVENFPDQAFRKGILSDKTVLLDKDGKPVVGTAHDYGWTLSKSDCEKVTKVVLPAKAKDAKGVEFFPNLKEITVKDGSNLESADLSNNEKLVTVNFVNVSELETLVLPKTDTLENVIVVGDVNLAGSGQVSNKTVIDGNRVVEKVNEPAPLYQLDLSANKRLKNVTVMGTLVAKLDLSNNPYLRYANVDHNKINTLDLTNNFALDTLICTNNMLYGLDVPNTSDLEFINASHNILQEFDTTGLSNCTTLALNDNELRTLDPSPLPANVDLYLANNHIGALDLSGFTEISESKINPQILFVDSVFDEVNLTDNVEGFDKTKAAESKTAHGTYDEKTGVYTLNKDGVQGNGYGNGYDYKTGAGKLYVKIIRASVMNRLYNPNSGEHFYTSDINEKDVLVGLGWHDEGIGWTSPMESKTPVYRLYNPNAGDHHYTTSSVERDTLVSVGWKSEGIGWYSYTPDSFVKVVSNSSIFPDATIPAVAVWREYNPNAKAAGSHNYTVNRAENDFLVSVGWLDEGIAWYAMK